MTRVFMFEQVDRWLSRGKTGSMFGRALKVGGKDVILITSTSYLPGLEWVAATGLGITGGLAINPIVAPCPKQGLKFVCWAASDGRSSEKIRVRIIPFESRFTARMKGVLDGEAMYQKIALIVGLGSVGGPIANQFARGNVGILTLVDDEVVEVENIGRTIFNVEHLGMPKVEAAREILQRANPDVHIDARREKLTPELLAKLSEHHLPDLVVNAASSTVGFMLADAFHGRAPVLHPGIYAKASGGEVFLDDGDRASAACFACFRSRFQVSSKARKPTLYGFDNDLQAEPGLGADIAHVTSITASIGLRMLGGKPVHGPAGERLLMVSNAEGFFGSPYETQWVTIPRAENCPFHEEASNGSNTISPEVLAHIEGLITADAEQGVDQ